MDGCLLKAKTATEDQPLAITEEPESMSELPKEWAELDDEEIIEKLKEKDLPKEIFSHFVDSENWEVRQAIALNQETPSDVIEQLRGDEDDDVKEAVAYRELPGEWRVLDDDEKLEKLKEDNIPSNVLETLAKSNNWEIRKTIVENQQLEEEVIDKLVENENNDDVKESLILKAKLSKKSLELLYKANQDNPWIVTAFALSPNTPYELLEELRKHKWIEVRDAANFFRNLPEEWRLPGEGDEYEQQDEE